MALDLLTLEPQIISRNLRGKFSMFYGLPGIGKTSLGALFPSPLIMGFEMGTNALNNIHVAPVKGWQDWKSFVSQLTKKQDLKNKFETIVIDTADSAWDLCVKWVCAQNSVENLGDIPWGRGYDIAKKEYQNGFRELTFAGYSVIFISHSVEKTLKDETGQEYVQVAPALPARPYDIVNKMVDLIGYIREVEDPEAEDHHLERYIFFRGDRRFFAKSRFKYIKPYVKFSYENIVDAIYEAIDEEIKHSGGDAITTASEAENPYLVQTFDDLMEEARSLWGSVVQKEKAENATKILAEVFGKPTRFSEILPEQIDELKIAMDRIKEIL